MQLAQAQRVAMKMAGGCHDGSLVYRLLNPLNFVAFKMGRLRGGPSRTGAQGAYLDRYVTDEQ
jgi:hypothetical protein